MHKYLDPYQISLFIDVQFEKDVKQYFVKPNRI